MGIYVNDKRRTWSKAKNPSGGFSLKGSAPEGVDVAAVEAMLEKRREAKKAKDFGAADDIQEELLAMGVFVNDKERTWMAKKEPRSKGPAPFTLSGAAPEGVDVAAVEALLEERIGFKKARDWAHRHLAGSRGEVGSPAPCVRDLFPIEPSPSRSNYQ